MNEEEYSEYKEMLKRWRYSPFGDPLFRVNTVEYDNWNKRFMELKKKATPDQIVSASKEVGWK